MITLPHLASRIFDTPLAIHRQKLEVIVQAIGPRLQGMPMSPLDQERMKRKPYMVTPDGVAVIDIMGTLVHRSTGMDALSGLTSYGDIENELVDACTDPAIRAVILNIDSPGGEVQGMFDLADEIYSARDLKPICALADSAYSAAYLLASAASEIWTPRTGGVGSIDIICQHLDQSQSDAKEGLKYTVISSGARKTDGNPHEPLTDAAYARIKADVDRLDGMFADMVARNRGMKVAAIQAMDGMTYMGEQGVSARLSDNIGTLNDCMASVTSRLSNPRAFPGASASAAAQSQQNGVTMPDLTQPSAATSASAPPVAAAAIPAAAAAAIPTPAPPPATAAAPSSAPAAADETAAILELCAIAGTSASVASGFISKGLTRAQVSGELLKQRAAASGPEIASNILPDAGTSAEARPSQSPVVKACEAIAASAKQGGK